MSLETTIPRPIESERKNPDELTWDKKYDYQKIDNLKDIKEKINILVHLSEGDNNGIDKSEKIENEIATIMIEKMENNNHQLHL